MESKLIREEYKKAIVKKKADLKKAGRTVSTAEAKAILKAESPELYETLRAKVRKEFQEQGIQRIVLSKLVYKKGYHGKLQPKPASISRRKYAQDLSAAKGPRIGTNRWDSPDGNTRILEDGSWHHRFSKNGGGVGFDSKQLKSGEDLRRFYFNVKPDNAADLTNYLNSRLNAPAADGGRIRWQYKVAKNLKGFDRPDPAVLYIDKADYSAAKEIVMEYARTHPQAFAPETPAFTKELAPGIAVAEEPIQKNMPKTLGGKHSFGGSRSEIVADAILKAPPGATKDEITALVRERMKEYHLDPDRPWLADPSGPDL